MEYLRYLRQKAEARRSLYAAIAPVESIQQVIARQVRVCHSAILSDEKNEQCDMHNVVDNMSHIAQQIIELTQQINAAQQINACIIDLLYALAGFISEINNMPQLRRIYSSGEIIYRLNYISKSTEVINQIKTVVQYMSWITTALTQSKPIIKAEFAAQNKYYILAIHQMYPAAGPAASPAASPNANIKYMFSPGGEA